MTPLVYSLVLVALFTTSIKSNTTSLYEITAFRSDDNNDDETGISKVSSDGVSDDSTARYKLKVTDPSVALSNNLHVLVANSRTQNSSDILSTEHPYTDNSNRTGTQYPTSVSSQSDGPAKGSLGRSLGRDSSLDHHRNRKLVNAKGPKGCGRVTKFAQKIVGGQDASIQEFPWIVLLAELQKTSDGMKLAKIANVGTENPEKRSISYLCGGSLIADKWVLTASHCICHRETTNYHDGERAKIGATTRAQKTGFVEIDSEKLIRHEHFKPEPHLENDIGLIKLQKSFRNFDKQVKAATTICLPFDYPGNDHLKSNELVVTGWGLTKTIGGQEAADNLQKLHLDYVDNSKCKTVYQSTQGDHPPIHPQKNICGGGVEGQDSCNGDSGGPLMLEKKKGIRKSYTQVGLVSFGPNECGTKDVPGVYTRVAFFLDWILDHLE